MAYSTQFKGQNLLDFAQILYKCKLCSILPAVSTEKHEFFSHMQQVHFGANLSMVQCKNLQDDTEKSIPFVISPPYSKVEESAVDYKHVKIKEEKHDDQSSEIEQEVTNKNYGARSPSPVPLNQQSQNEIIASLMKLQYADSDENEHEMEKNEIEMSHQKCDDPVPNFHDLKERFGRYASSIVMRGKQFFYCQICQDKCETELQLRDHMNSSEHRVIANELEANTLAAEKRSPRRRNSPYFTSTTSMANPNSSHSFVKSIVPLKNVASRVHDVTKSPPNSNDIKLGSQAETSNPQISSSIFDSHKRSLSTNHVMSPLKKSRLDLDAQKTSPDGLSLVNLEKFVGRLLEEEKTSFFSSTNKTGINQASDQCSSDVHTCIACDFKYSEYSQFVKHYSDEHYDMAEMLNKSKEGVPYFSETLKIKELKDHMIATLKNSEHGYVGRHEILERFKDVTSMPAAINWGTVCNKCIKTTFPHIIILRKGKLKKTYYQGVEFINPNCQTREEQLDGSPRSTSPHSVLQESEDVRPVTSEVQNFSEGMKIEELKQYIRDSVVTCVQSCVGRSELIERFGQMTAMTAAISWGPVCNRVVKEIFPQVQIQRKGKYKHYYFGIKLINPTCDSSQKEDLDGDEGQYMFSPIRDITKDVETLVTNLPKMVKWSGKMNSCVPRDVLLHLAADSIGDNEVLEWGCQCNKAIRILYPEVFTKRKGKYKTTCFFGLELIGIDSSKFTKPWRNNYIHRDGYARDDIPSLASDVEFNLINQSKYDYVEIGDDDSDHVIVKDEPMDHNNSKDMGQLESETLGKS